MVKDRETTGNVNLSDEAVETAAAEVFEAIENVRSEKAKPGIDETLHTGEIVAETARSDNSKTKDDEQKEIDHNNPHDVQSGKAKTNNEEKMQRGKPVEVKFTQKSTKSQLDSKRIDSGVIGENEAETKVEPETKKSQQTIGAISEKVEHKQKGIQRPASKERNISEATKASKTTAKEKRVAEASIPNAERSVKKLSWKERFKNWRAKRLSQRGKHPMPAILRIPCAVLFLAIIAIFLTWFMIWRTNLCDAGEAMKFIQEKTSLACYNYIVIFSLLAVLAAITWRPFLSTGIVFAGLSIISFIHIQKYQLRAEPLLPEEFALMDAAGDLIGFVDMGAIMRLVWGVTFVLVGSILLEYYVRKFVGRSSKNRAWWDRSALVPRVTFSIIALALLATTVNPILRRKNTEWLEELNIIVWDQTRNYRENGFVIGFIYNLGNSAVTMPEDYSEARMTEIAEKYRTIKQADKANRLDWGDEVDNVIIILSETSYDPALLTKYYDHYGGDVTPNLHQIFQDYPSGYMYSPEYGGGTANVEFEVQTGLSNYWARTYPYVNVISKLDNFYGVAAWSKNFGFDTTAIHSYSGTLYKRNIVYPKIGYDVFIDQDKMKYTEHDYSSTVINDQSIYREIIDTLKNNDNKQMIGVATMQNHSDYNQAQYPNLEFRLKQPVTSDYPETWAIEASYQSLHEADRYLGEFIEELDKLNERTVVLWFGDHAMGMLDQYAKSDDQDDRNISRLTPYFVYTNFEPKNTLKLNNNMEELGLKVPGNLQGVDLPTTSPNCLQNTMYNILGVQKPAFFYLLDEVCATNPVLANIYSDNVELNPNEALSEYELVNYDMLIGKRYWDGD